MYNCISMQVLNTHSTGYYYFLGATDAVVEGEWRWRSDNVLMSNRSNMSQSAVPWCSGEPNSGTSYNWLIWYPDPNCLYDYYWLYNSRYICQHRGTSSSHLLQSSILHLRVLIQCSVLHSFSASTSLHLYMHLHF